MTQIVRNETGRYTAMEAGHDVDIQRVRFGDWQGWWTLYVDGEDCGWHFRTKQQAVAAMPDYVDGYIRASMTPRLDPRNIGTATRTPAEAQAEES